MIDNSKNNADSNSNKDKSKNKRNKMPIDHIAGETWKVIPGYERYMISNFGRIYGFCQDAVKEVNTYKGKQYYMTRLVNSNGVLEPSTYIHRLVAQAFCINDDPENKREVHHKNGNSLDNSANNLEWINKFEHLQLHKSWREAAKEQQQQQQ